MTALDQAFIKAFTRQNTSPLPVTPRPTSAVPRQPHLPIETGRGEREAPKPKGEDLRRTITEEQPSHASSFSSPTPTVAIASSVAIQPSPQTVSETRFMPLSATLEGVWAALGRPPRAVAELAREETAAKDEEDVSAGSRCSTVESSLYASSEPVGPCFSATTIEPAETPPVRRAIVESTIAEPAAAELAAAELATAELATAPSAETPTSSGGQEVERVLSEAAPVLAGPSTTPLVSLRVRREFKPGWQVDQFTWPKVCRRLIARAAEELDRLADALMAANAQGQKVLAIGGYRRGEGATTLLLCAARRLAERGIKPVLVDADLNRPRLAKRLCLQPQFGWDETSDAPGRALDQAIVEATANNMALLPACEPTESGRPAGDRSRLAFCLDTLRDHYDMVLVDFGPLEDVGLDDPARTQEFAHMIDAIILVHNDRITSEERLTTFTDELAAAGITTAGIVENFVPED